MPDVHLMHKTLALLASCALLAACGSSTPTGPSQPPTLSRTHFLAFGDSLTAGEVTVPVGLIPNSGIGALLPPSFKMLVVPAASYPTQLLSLMQSRYAAQAGSFTMPNVGKPGEYSFQGVQRFPSEMAASSPEVVLLLEGVNDLSIFGPGTPAMSLLEMMAEGRRRGARVLVATMMPSKPGGRLSQNPAVLEELNAMIKVNAANEQAVVVDLYNALLPEVNTVIGVDGLHPTEVGYKRMADVFFAAVQANLEVK
jgi:hypothetical protein